MLGRVALLGRQAVSRQAIRRAHDHHDIGGIPGAVSCYITHNIAFNQMALRLKTKCNSMPFHLFLRSMLPNVTYHIYGMLPEDTMLHKWASWSKYLLHSWAYPWFY